MARPWLAALPLLLLWLAVALWLLWFAWLTLNRYWAFEARALDLGNLHQAIWNTAHGNWFRQTNQPGTLSRLSLHVEPILLPIAALFRLLPRVELLLVLQATTVALGALPLFALGRRQFAPSVGPRAAAWPALAFALGWLTMPALQAATWIEFHPVTLAPTFFLAAFYFLVQRRAGWFALFALLAAACKEDLGLIVALIGLYALLAQKQRRLGLITIALGVGWSLLAVLGIQGSSGGNMHWWRYGWLGESPGEIVRTLITRPLFVARQMVEWGALRTLAQLLLPMGFLALLAPEVLLLALPSLGVNLLADYPPMHEVNTLMYAAPIAPFVALAAVMGSARLLAWLQRRGPGGSRTGWMAAGAILVLLAGGALAAQAAGGYLPGAPNAHLFEVSEHDERAAAIIDQIGADESVSAQDKLNPHTAGRYTSLIFPRVADAELGIADADALFVDVTGPAWPQHPSDLHASIQQLLAGDYGVAAADDGYLLLRRGAGDDALPDSFFTPWRGAWPAPATAPPGGAPVRYGDALELLGVDVASDEHGEVVVRSQWRALRPLSEPLQIHLVYQTADGERRFDSRFYPPVVTLWYPVTQWQPGETVLVTSLPWALGANSFSLLVGAYAGESPERGALPIEGAPAAWLADEGRLLNMGSFAPVAAPGLAGRLTAVRTWLPVATPPAVTIEAPFVHDDTPQLTLEAVEIGVAEATPAGLALPVTLRWRVERKPQADYSVFVHLLDSSGEKWSQWDGPPLQGAVPVATSRLAAGDTLLGTMVLMLPTDARGDFTLVAGLYDWQSGAALTLPDGASSVQIGSVRLP